MKILISQIIAVDYNYYINFRHKIRFKHQFKYKRFKFKFVTDPILNLNLYYYENFNCIHQSLFK